MYEEDITGVRDPSTGTLGFISVMGNLGEHYAITVYLGERALGQYLELSKDTENTVPEMVLEIPQLMLSFGDKEFLEKEDRAVMRAIGYSYAARKSWPLFRSYKPGMVPWFLEEDEIESMGYFLEQFFETALDSKPEDRAADTNPGRKNVYLVRELKGNPKNQEWKSTMRKIVIPALEEILYTIDPGLLARTKRTPIGRNIFEVDFFLTTARVREKNKRPYFSYLLLVVDQKSEIIISNELLDPTEGIGSMLVKIPALFLNSLNKSLSLPQAVHVGSLRLADLLSPLMKNLGIQLQYKPDLKSLEMAKNSIT
jgi:hypothetical protein